jgi:hypothetical protein
VDAPVDYAARLLSTLKGLGLEKTKALRDEDPTEIEEEGSAPEEKQAASPVSPTTINLFQHPDAHPLVLEIALLQKYGPEYFLWEAETLEWRIPQDFKTRDVSDLNMNKIQALKTMHVSDRYWTDWEIFNWCTAPLSGLYPDFEVMQVPTLAQCAVSVDIAARVRTDVAWSEEVKGFLEVVYRHDGIFCPIPPLDFVSIDATGLVVDCEEVQKLWPDVRRTGRAPTEETVTAEQLRRALGVYRYVEENRELLRQQLPLVLNA